MCDLIIKLFPRSVEHIGNMPLAGQIAAALLTLAVIVGAYILIYNAALQIRSGTRSTRRARRVRRPNNFNWLVRYLTDDEPYQDWMDAEAWRESLR